MRITGGMFRGRKLHCPKGRLVRPTTDRVREALFQIIASNFSPDLSGLKVLDLFAGTGALGLEAMSRGADFCVFVEHSVTATKSIANNICILGLNERTRVIKNNVFNFLANSKLDTPFDLILCDPPYGKGHIASVLSIVAQNDSLLKKGGLLVFEERKDLNIAALQSSVLELVKHKSYGDTILMFYLKNDDSNSLIAKEKTGAEQSI